MSFPFPRPFPGPSVLTSFSVLSLFAAGEQGAWYDPSDLDRYISPVGSELVTNGTFDSNTTGWTTQGSTSISVASGTMVVDQPVAGTWYGDNVRLVTPVLTVGKFYRISFDARNTVGTNSLRLANNATPILDMPTITSTFQRFSVVFQCTVAATFSFFKNGLTGTFELDNISVKELTALDTATMFQDSAGTTPVTAVEQPVGLLLDKSKGGRQSLAVTGWAKNSGDGTVTVDGNTITITGATTTTRVDIVAPGWAVGDYADITVTGSVAGATGQILYLGGGTLYSTLSGTNTFRNVIVSSTLLRLQINTGAATFVVTSRGYVPGNHASQSTAASRPVLSARVNLLTYSEQFDNAAWQKYSVAVPATKYADPYGGTTANLLYPTAATTDACIYRGGFASVSKTHSYAVKAAGKSWFCILKEGTTGGAAWFNLSTGSVGTVAAGYTAPPPTSLGNGWYRCSVTSTSGFSQYTAISAVDADNSTTPTPNGTDGIYIWGADLRVTNAGVNLPAYQRVAAATDYDTSGFPLYLKFDGVDDSLATGTIDPGAVDKAQVFAGASALAPKSNNSPVWQFGDVTTSATDAMLRLVTGDGSTDSYRASVFGSGANSSPRVTKVVPYTGVFSALYDAAETGSGEISVRENAVVTAVGSATDSGVTSVGSQVLYIGRQSTATGYLNGNLYSMILRFSAANLSDAQIASTETYVNSKTGAY